MDNSDQFLQGVIDIIDSANDRYDEGEVIEARRNIPSSDDMPLESNKWLKVEDVVCVYIDMKNSTQLSAQTQDKFTAGIYQYFTDTAVRILDNFGASYIDVRGDGAFGLFKKDKIYHAFCSAVTFRTFVEREMVAKIGADKPQIACHIGIDMKTVLVKRIGMRKSEGQSSKQNEVWAGKPVNMAAKLASHGDANEITVSDRVYKIFTEDGSDLVLKSCGCRTPGGEKVNLWTEVELGLPIFDFEKAYVLKVAWCESHGREFCLGILDLDT